MQAVLKFALGAPATTDPRNPVQILRARAEGLRELSAYCRPAYVSNDFSDWRHIFARLPVSAADYKASFPSAPDPRAVRTSLRAWMERYSSRPTGYRTKYADVHAFIGVLLMTWYGLRHSELLRSGLDGRGVSDSSVTPEECESAAAELLARLGVADALLQVYSVRADRPPSPSSSPGGQSWADLVSVWNYNARARGLSFHKYGTTSLIVKRQVGGEWVAIKLVLLPYAALPAVAQSTRDYFDDYTYLADVASGQGSREHLVKVKASFDWWIIMRFVRGQNLSELLATPEAITAKLLHPDLGFVSALRETIFLHSLKHSGPGLLPVHRHVLSGWTYEQLVAELRRRLEVSGESAASYLREAGSGHSSDLASSIRRLRILGKPIFSALMELESAARARVGSVAAKTAHEDLTPSNIIVDVDSDQETVEVTLIDFGKNHLHTRLIAGRLGRDASYVAPEILEDRPVRGQGSADLYSLGQLLISCAGLEVTEDGAVPDPLYSSTPLIARFLEDLVQRNPVDRLRIFRPSRMPEAAGVYDGLKRYFDNELDAVERALGNDAFFTADRFLEAVSDDKTLTAASNVLRPLSGAPRRQWRLWRETEAQVRAHRRPGDDGSRKLALWSVLSAGANAVAFFVLSVYVLRDANQEWVSRPLGYLQQITGSDEEELPLLDSLRQPGYQLGDWRANGPTWLVCASYIVLCARYYQALYAGLTPALGARGWKDVGAWGCAAEFFMRAHTLIGPVLALVMVLVDSSLWPVATFIGQTAVLFCNASVGHFMKHSFEEAQYYRRANGHMSTVPLDKTRITGYSPYFGWWKSGIFYSAVILAITFGLSAGYLHDEWTYALMVAGINVFSFYLVKVGTDAPEVRIALARACLTAERLRVMRREGVLPLRRGR